MQPTCLSQSTCDICKQPVSQSKCGICKQRASQSTCGICKQPVSQSTCDCNLHNFTFMTKTALHMTDSSFGTEGIIKNTMHFLFCCTFHMIQDDGYSGTGSTKKGWGVRHCCCFCSISASFLFALTTSSQEVQEK